jgi:hypothetical protein
MSEQANPLCCGILKLAPPSILEGAPPPTNIKQKTKDTDTSDIFYPLRQ